MDARGIRGLGAEMERELVTVLMPVRDTPAWMLETAIESVLAQTFGNFEFLIADDGSRSRDTLACLDRAASRDARVRIEQISTWISASSGASGVTRALNIGLGLARGEFIARQDADDWSEPGRLARQMEFFARRPETVLCGSAAWRHRQDGSRLWLARMPCSHDEIEEALEQGNPFFHGSVVFRKSAAVRIGGYRPEFSCSQDYDFFWRLAETGEAANLGDALYHYRHHAESVSVRRAAEQARVVHATRILKRARERGEIEDVAQALGSSIDSFIPSELKQADHLLLAGEFRRAWRGYWQVLKRRPSSAAAWGKMARYGLFAAIPAAREFTFGRSGT